MTRLSSHGPRARAEFRRLLLESRIDVVESELATRRSRRQRLRARRVERRLTSLRSLLRDLEGERTKRRSWMTSRPVGYVVIAAWAVGAAWLTVELARHGLHSHAAAAGIVAMLLLSLLWFALAIARVPLSAASIPAAGAVGGNGTASDSR